MGNGPPHTWQLSVTEPLRHGTAGLQGDLVVVGNMAGNLAAHGRNQHAHVLAPRHPAAGWAHTWIVIRVQAARCLLLRAVRASQRELSVHEFTRGAHPSAMPT